MSTSFSGSGSGDRLNLSSAVVSAVPLTLALWVFPTNDVESYMSTMAIGNEGSNNDKFILRMGSSSKDFHATIQNGGVTQAISTGSDWTVNGGWYHHGGTFSSGTVILYVNGVNRRELSHTSSPTVANTYIGYGHQGLAANRWFEGNLAEAGVWNRVLTAEEMAALAAGYSPLCFPNGLVWYVPMLRSNNARVGATPSVEGTLGVADHPPIIYPRRRRTFHPTLGGAAPPAAQQFVIFPPRMDGIGRGGIFLGNRVQ